MTTEHAAAHSSLRNTPAIVRAFGLFAMAALLVGGFVFAFAPRAAAAQDGTYIVQPGDTLLTIAQKLGISAEAIAQANNLDLYGATLFVGDELVIPADAPPFGLVPPLTPFVGPDGQGGGGVFYVVQPRDVLDLIASYYDVEIGCLSTANALDNPFLIFPGQTLLIPENCPPYRGLSTAFPRFLGGLQVGAPGFSPTVTALPNTGGTGGTGGGSVVTSTSAPAVIITATPSAFTPIPAQSTPAIIQPTQVIITATPVLPTVAPATFAPTQEVLQPTQDATQANATAAVTRGPTRTPTVVATASG